MFTCCSVSSLNYSWYELYKQAKIKVYFFLLLAPKRTISFMNALVSNRKKKDKQTHAVTSFTLGIPLILTSFYIINTKNTQVTLRRECAYSAFSSHSSKLADITVSRAGGGHQERCFWHSSSGKNSSTAAMKS